ncbi:AAA family ATPase [Polyangium aurulentum]|uniref:AAA family ATPase n=1 Tax=Polyangium aurulentum TaxID=2567896 RepID=UPI0010AE353B|nr:AAA family ATPase [Polyangium aurulentum]UQA56206.1 AAA family ATPase [Polyangium aurulentum]
MHARPAQSADAKTLPIQRWLQAAIAASDALAKLHQSGIIHQNIRPQTLRIDVDGDGVELTGADTGEPAEPSALKMPRDALPYIAPEQTGRVESAIDHRADLYSLGIVLYEMLARALPFHAEDPLGWVHCHVARAPRPLEEAAPETPAMISSIVMRLLAKSPDERYQSARGLEHDLRRCLSELLTHGHIEPFPLGARDVWDKLRAASRMFGRSEELATLGDALERVRSMISVEVALVAGPSGIGKSSLVRELQRVSGGARAAFLFGKFEQTKRDIPYATLGQAFQDLVRQTVASSDEELAALRERLAGALGDNGQLIVDLIPQIELIIGKQPPLQPLPASDARNRFHLTFRSFLGVFAVPERPLVLFLDDLQWADFASLELLQHVVTHSDVRSLLLVGAYRDDEVDASHPLAVALREVGEAGVPVTTLHLGPLAQADLVDLVVDVFGCDRDDARPLAALLWAKTNGNPFFAVQLLGALHQEHLIRFDAEKWAWRWNIAELEAKGITDDMVSLVLGKLRRLPEGTLETLKLAACIGAEFSVQLIGTLSGKSPEEIRASLEPALAGGLLLQRPAGYKFLHDRVQQAVYSLTPKEQRAGLHLRLGWLLLESTPDKAIDDALFDIVNQLNLGVAGLTAPDERRTAAELNLRAGRKAKAASAARSAGTYLATGLSLLPWDGWGADYPLAYGLHLELAECEYLSGRFEEAERLCALLIERARTRVDKAAAYRQRMQLATAQVDNARAVELGLSCLRLFGIHLEREPSDDVVLAEIGWVRERLVDRAIEDLIDLPVMNDPDMIAAMEVLSSVYPAAAYVAPNLSSVVIARMVRLSILHGNTAASVHGYVLIGNVLSRQFSAFNEGYRFGKLAWELGQRPGFGGYNAEAAVIFGAMILPWSRHLRDALEQLRLGFHVARASGRLIYATSSLLQQSVDLIVLGEPLEAVQEALLPAFEFAKACKYEYMADGLIALQRLVLALRGATDHLGTLSGDGFDEGVFEDHLASRSIPLIRYYYYVHKLKGRFLAGDAAGAYAAAKEADEQHWSTLYTVSDVDHDCYKALAAAALHEGSGQAARAEFEEVLATSEARLRRWAEACPDNFAGKHALVSAEIARIEGREHEAAKRYDEAVRASRKSGFVQDEGIACELGARFYHGRGFDVLPAAYLHRARVCFERWGAHAKVRQLEQAYADLLSDLRRESSRTPSAEAEQIDTLTAAKASAAISSEMAPSDLLATLMRILIEHAGAQRSCLLVPSRDGLSVAAEISSDHEGVRVDIPKSRRAPGSSALPLSLANYVRRTREKMVLDDVTAQAMFSTDAYLSAARPRSMLCAPIVRRGEVAGVLYLENRLMRGAFTPRRLALLEFLSAVSLENALLAADLARETAERTQAEKTLKQSEERLQRLVETANVVPWEADRETGQFSYVGPQVVKMLGYSQDAWLSPGFIAKHVHPEDRESTLLHIIEPSGDEGFDFRMTAADGRTMWLHNVVSARGRGPADTIGGFLFDVTERKSTEAMLKEKIAIIESQKASIQRLSTPIIEVWEGVLTMPVLGVVDGDRAEQMMNVVLDAVSRASCRHMILDLTGADAVDTNTADHIMKIVRAVRLLGAQCIVVGIRPEVAQTIVTMGVDLSSIVTLSNLRGALLMCMKDPRSGRARAGNQVKK